MNAVRHLFWVVVSAAVLALVVPVEWTLDRAVAETQSGRANMVVRISWQTPADVDLHVFEPNGQHCYFGNRSTSNGGRLDHDARRGPGEEQYTILSGPSGRYTVEVRMYNDNGAPETVVTVQIWENGRLTRGEPLTLRISGAVARFHYNF